MLPLRALLAFSSLVLGISSRRQPRQDVSDPNVLVMGPVEDIKLAAQLDKEILHLHTERDSTAEHGAAPENSNPLEDLGKGIETVGEKYVEKPLMDSIHVFRLMMCWERPELIAHKKCMNYMVHHCAKGRSGKGYCKKLTNMLTKKCLEGDDRAVPYARKLELPCSAADEAKAQAGSEELEASVSEDDPNEDMAVVAPAAPGPAPGPAAATGPAPAPAPMITDLDKVIRPLPVQGYNEFSHGANGSVMHEDSKTLTSDWRMEWPDLPETEGRSVERICEDQPDHDWCKLYLADRGKTQSFLKSFQGDVEDFPPSHEEVRDHIDETEEEGHEWFFDRRPKHDDALEKS